MNISALLRRLFKLIFVPRCSLCPTKVADYHGLCNKCWQKIRFIGDPRCKICGYPLQEAAGDLVDEMEENQSELNFLCGQCILEKPRYDLCVAITEYNHYSSSIIKKFKYRDRVDLAPFIAHQITSKHRDLIEESDIICPVPLHRFRLMWRTYNQAALICNFIRKTIRKESGKGPQVIYDLLERTRYTKPQVLLTQRERKVRLSGVFRVRKKYRKLLHGKNILIVDDVITTASTINECSKAIRRAAKVSKVNAVVFAKTVRSSC